MIRTSVEDWKTTPWRKIDVENMDIECKKFAKDIRGNVRRSGQPTFSTGTVILILILWNCRCVQPWTKKCELGIRTHRSKRLLKTC